MDEKIKSELAACGIDLQSAVARLMNNEALYLRLLKKFPADKSYQELIDGLAAKDYDMAFRGAHTLKGVSGNLSMNDLMDITVVIVEKLRSENYDELDQDAVILTEHYEKVINVINKLS